MFPRAALVILGLILLVIVFVAIRAFGWSFQDVG
jgi:hypothetical protein